MATLTTSVGGVTIADGAISAASLALTTDLPVSEGGTGASTAQDARTNLLPTKTGNALKVLRVNAGETDYELAASAGGSGLTHPQVMARGVFGGPF